MKKEYKFIFLIMIFFIGLSIIKADAPSIPEGTLSNCNEILGANLTAIVKASITILEILGAIIAIVKGMMTLIPPILAKDADALQKASKTLVNMAIILVVIFIFISSNSFKRL